MAAVRTDTMSADEHASALQRTFSGMRVKSVTFDNGIENKKHRLLGVPTFFCDPYSSWQKGSVENVNKLIRRYLPKGTNFVHISPERIAWIVQRINHKPRRILGYRTAHEVAVRGGLFLNNATVS
jgi:IS30 family transposase